MHKRITLLSFFLLFYKKNWRTKVLFVGPLIPLFWTSDDVSSGFQSQRRQPYSHLVEAYVLPIHIYFISLTEITYFIFHYIITNKKRMAQHLYFCFHLWDSDIWGLLWIFRSDCEVPLQLLLIVQKRETKNLIWLRFCPKWVSSLSTVLVIIKPYIYLL